MKRSLSVLATIAGILLIAFGFDYILELNGDASAVSVFASLAFQVGGIALLAVARFLSTGRWFPEDAAEAIPREGERQ